MAMRPIADDLFTWQDDNPRLIGGRCQACGAHAFPARTGCAKCGAADMRRCELMSTGTLWTWTSQGFVPKAPFTGTFMTEPVEPWYVGLVELPGQLRVESILTGCSQETLRFGLPMRLVTLPFSSDGAGDEVVTFAFAPVEAPGGVSAPSKEAASA